MLYPKTRDDLTIEKLDGESVVYDQASGNVHHLNGTATIVFSLLDGGSSLAEIATDIADAVGRPTDEIQFQVHQLVEQFQNAGLLD